MEYIIRNAESADALKISQNNVNAAWDSEKWEIQPEVALKGVLSIINDPTKGFYVVAQMNDDLIGQLMITYEWSDWRNQPVWWIQSVFVAENMRRKGIFKSLYEHIIQKAKLQNVASVKLYVDKNNERAKLVYRSLGMNDEHYDLFEINL